MQTVFVTITNIQNMMISILREVIAARLKNIFIKLCIGNEHLGIEDFPCVLNVSGFSDEAEGFLIGTSMYT